MARSPTRKRKLALSLKLARKWAKEQGIIDPYIAKGTINRTIWSTYPVDWVGSKRIYRDPLAVIEDFTASNGEWWCRVKDLTKNQLVNDPKEW